MNEKISFKNRASGQIADMECASQAQHHGEVPYRQTDKRVCIHVHSIRKRVVDVDGISAKAAIDGIVRAGILKDDQLQYVKEITYSQEACDRQNGEEKTIIEIYEEAN